MWSPPNIQSPPSKKEIQGVKEEVTAIELEIVEAELRLDTLRKSLSERKAWIAPIRMIPPEILSLIFIEASRNDWKTPLVLQSVCRLWRDTVVDSSEAWTFIPLFKYRSAGRSELISLFLERCRNTPLHMSVRNDSLLGYMELLDDRIECISLDMSGVLLNRYLQRGHAFHRLKTLKIDINNPDSAGDASVTDELAAWDMSLFPNLKYLNIYSRSLPLLRAILAAPEFPAIQHLTVHCMGIWRPSNILTKCAMSLESVELIYDNWQSEGLDREHKIYFPRLNICGSWTGPL